MNNKTHLNQIVIPLLAWYKQHGRTLPWRSDPTPYRVWLSEIMLQQTRVETVKPYFERFLSALPNISDLALADEEQLLKLWEGLGYYSRVRNLQKAAQVIMQKWDGHIPASFNDLLTLPGIGRYTAGAISSIAFQIPVPVVDGNVLRVISRILESAEDISLKKTQLDMEDKLMNIIPIDQPGDFNQALMDLGATICLPTGIPKCEICPISSFCSAFLNNKTADYPVKTSKKPRKIETPTILLIHYQNKYALQKRPDKGLLAKMWEFPSTGNFTIEKYLKEKKIAPLQIKPLPSSKHIFTHIEWHINAFHIEADNPSDQFTWVSWSELLDKFALPSAFQPFLAYLKEKK